jgi:hypothetical protein
MLSKDSQKAFFVKMFGDEWTEKHITPLLNAGITLAVEFFQVKASIPKPGGIPPVTKHVTLSVSTSTLMKGSATDEQKKANLFLVEAFVQSIMKTAFGASPEATVSLDTTAELVAAAAPLNTVSAPVATGAPKVVKPKAKPTAQVVHLRDALAIGQKVFGTSGGSIYTVIALNPRVKIAARLKGHGLSIRAEFNGASEHELALLKQLGLQAKDGGQYMSTHMDLEEVPVGRVVGAMLMDSGIEFEDQIKSGKEITE